MNLTGLSSQVKAKFRVSRAAIAWKGTQLSSYEESVLYSFRIDSQSRIFLFDSALRVGSPVGINRPSKRLRPAIREKRAGDPGRVGRRRTGAKKNDPIVTKRGNYNTSELGLFGRYRVYE